MYIFQQIATSVCRVLKLKIQSYFGIQPNFGFKLCAESIRAPKISCIPFECPFLDILAEAVAINITNSPKTTDKTIILVGDSFTNYDKFN
jgi:hypothetical protein